jgi:lipopolysaccharide biosynthesis protein
VRTARWAYHAFPLSLETKRKMVKAFYAATGTLFRPAEVACPDARDVSAAVPFGYALEPGTPKLAVLCHVYYEDLAPELRHYLAQIPFGFDLFISTDSADKAARLTTLFREGTRGTVAVRVTPNRGRDIAPKLLAFPEAYASYDYVLHLHTKVSRHNDLLAPWRRFLLENLLGSPEIVRSVFDAFARHPELGMVAAQHLEYIRPWINWGANFPGVRVLAQKMDLKLVKERLLDFPSGSMFWARTAALKPLRDLNLTFEDFEPEEGQTDGTLAHAIERAYFIACERAGLRWMKIAHPPLFSQQTPVIPIQTPADLDRFLVQQAFTLLGPDGPKPRTEAPDSAPPSAALVAWLNGRL